MWSLVLYWQVDINTVCDVIIFFLDICIMWYKVWMFRAEGRDWVCCISCITLKTSNSVEPKQQKSPMEAITLSLYNGMYLMCNGLYINGSDKTISWANFTRSSWVCFLKIWKEPPWFPLQQIQLKLKHFFLS